MILYAIQAHRNIRQLIELCWLLRSPKSIMLCLIDEEGEICPRELHSSLFMFPETAIVKFVPSVTWGGKSQIATWLEAMDFADRQLGQGDWFINLSADCLPLSSPLRLLEYLSSNAQDGIKSYMLFYDNNGYDTDTQHGRYSALFAGCESIPRTSARHLVNFDVGRARVRADPFEVTENSVHRMIMQWPCRGAFKSEEIDGKRISVKRLTPSELESRVAFFDKFTLCGGRAWFSLHRTVVSAYLASRSAREIYFRLQDFLCGDEIFFQTLQHQIKVELPGECAPFNLHFAQGEPLEISDSNKAEILDTKAWFARKISYQKCPIIMENIRNRIVAEHY